MNVKEILILIFLQTLLERYFWVFSERSEMSSNI